MSLPRLAPLFLLFLGGLTAAQGPDPAPDPAPDPVADYVERYLTTYPGQATAAGRHDLDRRLEDLGPERREEWLAYNRRAAEDLRRLLGDPELPFPDRLDAELTLRQAELEIFDLHHLERPRRDPLFWTRILGNATVFLLVREDRPAGERLAAAAARAALVPRLVDRAREALASTPPGEIAPELCRVAARQAAGTARFYREGFPRAAGPESDPGLRRELERSGALAAAALEDLADFLERLAGEASGTPRLGSRYAGRFRLVTGVHHPVAGVLAEAEAALEEKRREAAAYGRSVWTGVMGTAEPPAEDRELLSRLFLRVAEDRAESVEEFVADYRGLVAAAVDFVRRRRVISLPGPLTLHTDRSPSFFVGQSVGGVYPAGPYAPEADTLFYLPTPPDDATPEQREAFFRDFNHHFNVMITAHEIVPGHYLQLKVAARLPRPVRSLFGDGVYVEGWGTFCERLMLDLGWGGPLDRLAHLKKQLENIARTVVDIRVHTRGMSRDEVLGYVQEEALQDEQFAANMWVRAITTSPQLTSYHLGYRQVRELFEDLRAAQGDDFDLRRTMDSMVALGSVPVSGYRRHLLEGDAAGVRR